MKWLNKFFKKKNKCIQAKVRKNYSLGKSVDTKERKDAEVKNIELRFPTLPEIGIEEVREFAQKGGNLEKCMDCHIGRGWNGTASC